MKINKNKDDINTMLKNEHGFFGIGCSYYPEHNTDYGDWITIGMPLKRRNMEPHECDTDDFRAVYLGIAIDNPIVGIRRDDKKNKVHTLEVFDSCVEMRLHWEVDFDSIPEKYKPYHRNITSIWD
jgi:hypothetical protein